MKNLNGLSIIFCIIFMIMACEKESDNLNQDKTNMKNKKAFSSDKSIVIPPTNNVIIIDTLGFILESIEDFQKLDTILDGNQYIRSEVNYDLIVENIDGSKPNPPESGIEFNCSYQSEQGRSMCEKEMASAMEQNRANGICFDSDLSAPRSEGEICMWEITCP